MCAALHLKNSRNTEVEEWNKNDLLGHLLIAFACSSKPTGRGAVNCVV